VVALTLTTPEAPPPQRVARVVLQPMEEKPEPPSAPAAPPLDPDFDAKMKAALADEEALRVANARHDMTAKFSSIRKGGIPAGQEVEAGQRVNSAFAAELADSRSIKQHRRENLTAEQKAREELRQIQQRQALDAFEARCKGAWMRGATAAVAKTRKEKLALLDPDAPGISQSVQNLNDDARDLRLLIEHAKSFQECRTALTMLDNYGGR
jgi:hypothetical protein